MNIEEISWPMAICVVLSVAVIKVSGCAENSDIEKTKQTQSYIESNCKKTAVMGSRGTHWVCDDSTKD